jgi:hypothetical protein
VYDQVGTYYQRGGRVITPLDGEPRTATTEVGSLSTTRKGTTHVEEGTTDPPLRAVFIELKQETGSGRVAPPSEVPDIFPREGARQLLDDARVRVWDYTWTDAAPVKRRFTSDTVVVWLTEGRLRVTADGGIDSVEDVAPGVMRYMNAGTTEIRGLLAGSPRALIFELK